MRESAQALRAFGDYLAQDPPRSLERLAQTYRDQVQRGTEGGPLPPTRKLSRLKEWSRLHGWQERVLAHERALAEQAERELVQRRLQAREARLGIAAQVLSESYRQFIEKARSGYITPYAALQAMQLAMDTQRKDLGEPDQRVEVGGPDGEAIAVRVIYDDEPSVGFGGRNGWSA
jgi:hypothetical protein